MRTDPAFPITAPSGDMYSGLSVREYAAIHILAGLVAKGANPQAVSVRQDAIQSADALLHELSYRKSS